MNLKKTLILGLLLALASLYLSQVMLPGQKQQALEGMAFARIERATIDSLDISHYNEKDEKERFVLMQSLAPHPDEQAEGSKEPELVKTWSLPSIRGAILDKTALESYLNALLSITIEGPLKNEELYQDIGVYGLDKPRVTVVLNSSGKKTEVAFGKRNEYLGKRYVKVSGRDGVFLSEDSQFEAVNRGSADLRSKTPFSFSTSDVREFLLTSIQGRVRVTQPEVGAWRIESPERLSASKEDVEGLLASIAGAQVEEFIDGQFEERNRYGFGLPRANVIILFREGIEPKEVSLFLANAHQSGEAKPQMYMYSSTSETIFKLASDPSDRLVQGVDGLREKRIVDIPYGQIRSIVAGGAQGTGLTITTKGIEWEINGKQSDPVFVEQLLKDISALRAVDFPKNISDTIFDKPYLTLDLEPKSADFKAETVVIGDEYADDRGNVLRYAKNTRNDTIYGIRDIEAKRIVPHEEALIEQPKKTKTK